MLSAFVPRAMPLLVAALLASAAAARAVPAGARMATLAVTAIGVALAATFLLLGSPPAAFALPVGLGSAGARFGLDGLSGFFLLPVLLAGLAAALSGIGGSDVRLPVLLAGLMLTLTAADGFLLLLGLGLVAASEWRTDERSVLPVLGLACLLAVVGLLPAWGGAAWAALPDLGTGPMPVPGAWRGAAAFLLLVIGTALLMRGSGRGSALAEAMAPVIALYVLLRVLFGLGGAAPPPWWGAVLLLAGGACAIAGGLRALAAAELRAAIAAAGLVPLGIAVGAAGLAVIAHAADLPPLASLGLGAVLLQAVTLALAQTLLLLGAVAVAEGAGTRRLDRLGGLVHAMRGTTACVAVGAAALAALPPAAGFAGAWLAFQALFASLRVGGMPLLLLLALEAAAMALGLGLGLAAMLRLLGTAFLGRPRSPRGAAAEEAPFPAILAMAGLAVLLLVLGLLPGAALALAAPALHALVGAQPDGRNSALALVPQAGQMPYSALAAIALLALLLLLILWAGRRWTAAGERRAPAWEDGFAAAPAWLPFGDPATEISPDSFAAGLRRPPVAMPAVPPALAERGWRLAARIGRLDPETAVPLALAVLAALLLLAWAAGA